MGIHWWELGRGIFSSTFYCSLKKVKNGSRKTRLQMLCVLGERSMWGPQLILGLLKGCTMRVVTWREMTRSRPVSVLSNWEENGFIIWGGKAQARFGSESIVCPGHVNPEILVMSADASVTARLGRQVEMQPYNSKKVLAARWHMQRTGHENEWVWALEKRSWQGEGPE